ncbi:MAG: ASKHA domain-containing protein, partial [Pseudomonadales bacterium]
PSALREEFGRVTVTAFLDEIIDVEPGDTADQKFGMAFDIGTTSVVGALIDLETGVEVAAVGGLNPQSPYGGDLMSRIAYVMENPKRLQTLRAKILGALNDYIKQACKEAKVNPRHIHKLVVVGNTCMHHIFVGIDPTYVGLAPYAPSMRRPLVLPGYELLLKTVPSARVCLLPIIAGFVGADTVAAALATRIYESEDYRVLVDIGTNGEVVMGKRGKLMACSAPAGPALEGAQIRHGMRGAVGAIEKISFDDDVKCQVIGNSAPIGICGSGMIDGVAAMLDSGALNESGLINLENRSNLPKKMASRLRNGDDRDEFVLCWADDSGNSEDITLNQSDIRQLQLAKGAICSGVMMLQKVLSIDSDQMKEVLLCGGFGNYISTRSAVRIRLLPGFQLDKITYFGNAAGLGAKMALLSEKERERASTLAEEIEHVSLATHPDFQEIFVEALKFPPAQTATNETARGAVVNNDAEMVAVS